MSYEQYPLAPASRGLTVLGLVLSYLTYQRRGLRPALLGVALSLLPIAAYLTGAIEMLWKVGVAIGQFATGFVFSPEKWAGIGVTGLAIALFLAAGGRQRRKAAREARRAARRSGRRSGPRRAAGRPPGSPRPTRRGRWPPGKPARARTPSPPTARRERRQGRAPGRAAGR